LIFFIVSCGRSGSTALSEICDAADNCTCFNEPFPESLKTVLWHVENNPHYDPRSWIKEKMSNAPLYEICGLKDPAIGPLIPYLDDVFDAKFVYLKRDGREVVRSLQNWNQQTSGMVYRECKEPVKYSQKAMKFIAEIESTPKMYLTDVVKPRPKAGEPFAKEWPELSRIEMYAWHWMKVNRVIEDNIKGRDFIKVDINNKESVFAMADYLGLKMSKDTIANMLNSKINSTGKRGLGAGEYPHWSEWTPEQTTAYNRVVDSFK